MAQMNKRAEYYKKEALRCRDIAAKAGTDELRQMLLDVAEQYDKLAEEERAKGGSEAD